MSEKMFNDPGREPIKIPPENLSRKTQEQVFEKSYYQIRCDFYEKFKTKIKPKILPFEKERRKKKTLALVISALLFVFAVLSLIFGFLAGQSEQFFILPFFSFVFAFAPKPIIAKIFELKVKKKVMPLVCSCFGKLFWAYGQYKGNVQDLNNSCVIPYYEMSGYDDIFLGEYKDVRFEILEAQYTKQEGSGKNRHTVTVFDGVILKLDMNKNFTGHTVIKPDTLLHLKPSDRLEHTVLEDVVFEEKFDVFCDDEIEARYLITPSFMERLTNIKTAFFAQKVSCAFYKEHLFIALQTQKDLFSLCSLDKPVDDFKQYNTLFEELLSAIKLIDHFKLDEKIGL